MNLLCTTYVIVCYKYISLGKYVNVCLSLPFRYYIILNCIFFRSYLLPFFSLFRKLFDEQNEIRKKDVRTQAKTNTIICVIKNIWVSV